MNSKRSLSRMSILLLLSVFGSTLVLAAEPLVKKFGFSQDAGDAPAAQRAAPMEGKGKKLLAIYMVGSDLESEGNSGTADLNELIAGYRSLSSAERNQLDVLVAFGGADKDGWQGMKFADIAQLSADAEDAEEYEDEDENLTYGNETGQNAYLYRAKRANMGDDSSFSRFMQFLADRYPENKVPTTTFLVLWDHGGSYHSCCNDDNFNGEGLNLDEIETGLIQAHEAFGVFDLIGFDQCLMASAEVANVMQRYATYMLASEETEPGHGWYWTDVITAYARQSDVVEAAKLIVKSFVQRQHGELEADPGKTLSILDLRQYEAFHAELEAVAEALTTNLNEYTDGIISAAYTTQDYGKDEKSDSRYAIDVKHLAQNLKRAIDDADLETLLDTLISSVERLVVYAKDDGTKPNSYGISIAPPEEYRGDAATYAASPQWLAFQESYVAYRESDTTDPTVSDFNEDVDADDVQVVNDWHGLAGILAAGVSNVMTATFDDDNLAKVVTVFGLEMEDFFWTVAELEAAPTENEGEYAAPDWGGMWYLVEYAPDQSEWIPLMYDDWYEEGDQTFTVYSAEIFYYEADSEEAQDAILELIVDDETGDVVDYAVTTYEMFYEDEDDEEGYVQFGRDSVALQPGDRIQFWTYAYNLADSDLDEWVETSDILTFEQEPVFFLDYLEFEDDDGNPLHYKQALVATDVNDNWVMTPLADVGLTE